MLLKRIVCFVMSLPCAEPILTVCAASGRPCKHMQYLFCSADDNPTDTVLTLWETRHKQHSKLPDRACRASPMGTQIRHG